MPIRVRMTAGAVPAVAAAAAFIGDASETRSAERTGQKRTARIELCMCPGTRDNDLGL